MSPFRLFFLSLSSALVIGSLARLGAQGEHSPFSTTRNGEVHFLDWTRTLESQISAPAILAVADNGDVLIRTQITTVQLFDTEANLLATYDDFALAEDAAFLPGGGFMITDMNNHNVRLYAGDGSWVRTFGGEGNGDGLFLYPRGIWATDAGEVYVADDGNVRVQVFNQAGDFQRQFSTEAVQTRSAGLCIIDNTVWVSDPTRGVIDVFSTEGAFVHSILEISRTSVKPASYGMPAIGLNHQPIDLEPAPNGAVLVHYGDNGGSRHASLIPSMDFDEVFSTQILFNAVGERGLASLGRVPWGTLIDPQGRLFHPMQDGNTVSIARQACTFPGSSPFPAGENAVPIPRILSITQRPETDLFDIQFEVVDDSPTVQAGFVVRTDATFDPGVNAVGVRALVEGTDALVGQPLTPNTPYTVTWDARADLGDIETDFFIEMLCRDERPVETIHYIVMPGAEGAEDLWLLADISNRVALLKWWMAVGDPDIVQEFGTPVSPHPDSGYPHYTISVASIYFHAWKLGIRETTEEEKAAIAAWDPEVSNAWVVPHP